MAQALSENTLNSLSVLSCVLFKCFIVLVFLLLLTWGAMIAMGDLAVQIHGAFFQVTAKEVDLLLLYYVSLMKALGIVFFLCPAIALKLFVRCKRKKVTSE